VRDIILTAPATITALATLFKVLSVAHDAKTAVVKVDEHNILVAQQLQEVKDSVNGQVEKLIDQTERAATAETLLSVRPMKPDIPRANPEENQ
jgi:homoserine kinase